MALSPAKRCTHADVVKLTDRGTAGTNKAKILNWQHPSNNTTTATILPILYHGPQYLTKGAQ